MIADGMTVLNITTRLGSTEELAKRYIRALDDYKPWPLTIEEAYLQANQFKTHS